MLKLDRDYKFVDFDDTPVTGIGLLVKEYEGVIYHYNQVKIHEEGLRARLEFQYTLLFPAKHDADLLMQDAKFHEIMGQILEQVIDIKLKEQENNEKN